MENDTVIAKAKLILIFDQQNNLETGILEINLKA